MELITHLTQEIKQLEKADYCWLSATKLATIQQLMLAHPAGLRDRKSGLHLSASAMVFDRFKGIFIRHPYLHTILLPAGHVEPEFHEETGLMVQAGTGQLIDVNLIQIPENPVKHEGQHQHVDFRYYFMLESQLQSSAELPVFRLEQKRAPEEFQAYFDLKLNS
ncbi:MAG: phosphohydrolase [Lentilactobacillus parabuchneri]|uniref:phosphohydrolase n=1 Tax=Lentilactobacillus parabuchneri TaxID=152331 RepID=UPI003F96A78C